MPKLCSIIMPTRSASHAILLKAVTSFLDAPGTNKDDVEVVCRVHDDDPDRIKFLTELQLPQVRMVIGPTLDGYRSLGLFVEQAVQAADSKWCWLVDDDVWIEGNWYGHLLGIPTNCAVNAQYYCLGPSIYNNGPSGGCVGLIIPTELAKSLPGVQPPDSHWLSVIMDKGWKCRQLPGVSYHHDGRPR